MGPTGSEAGVGAGGPAAGGRHGHGRGPGTPPDLVLGVLEIVAVESPDVVGALAVGSRNTSGRVFLFILRDVVTG